MAALHSISKGQLRMQLQEVAGSAVAVYPAFRKVLGLNAAASQFLSQAVYWTERTADGWFYKTESEWLEEVGLAAEEVRDARRNLKAIGILDEQRKGIPAKMFYRVNTSVLFEALDGNIQAVTLEQVLGIHGSKLAKLSKTGLMRAKKLGVKHEYVDYAKVLQVRGMVCGCCGKPIVRGPGKGGEYLAFDHIIPLAAGGTHEFHNLQPSHASCNGSKGCGESPKRTSPFTVIDSSSSREEELDLLAKHSKCRLGNGSITETTQEITAETTAETLSALPADAGSPVVEGELIEAGEEAKALVSVQPVTGSAGPRCSIPADMPGPKDQSCKTYKAWANYAMAYRKRYGVWPKWNATSGGLLAKLVARLGADDAHHVSAYYLTINDARLINDCHSLKILLAKAEAFHTQWATGRQMNATTARQIEQTQANINAAEEAARRILERGERNEFL